MLRDPELELAEILNASGLGVSMTSSPPSLYAGPIPAAAPDRVVAVQFSGGPSSDDYVNTGVRLFAPELEVTVRGTGYKATLDLALAAFWALHLPNHPAYSQIKAEGAGPLYAGPDESGRHVFEFDVSCSYSVSG